MGRGVTHFGGFSRVNMLVPILVADHISSGAFWVVNSHVVDNTGFPSNSILCPDQAVVEFLLLPSGLWSH